MPRFFLELAYKGTQYSGFQKQDNANTIQAEVEKAFQTLHRQPVSLVGSSRTDAGVHALQNYFHFDYHELHAQFLYKMNAILPDDIALKKIHEMPIDAHSRFHALSRKYEYRIYRTKNPFLPGQALYYPFKLNIGLMKEAAGFVKNMTSFFAFCKTNTQAKNFNCTIYNSEWIETENTFVYTIEGNRFLRGMVRLLTASMLQVGRKKISMDEFVGLFNSNDKCGFSIPADGLFLTGVKFPNHFLNSALAFI
jgi:tRNA pseudouridine38-40 synthase